MTSAPHRENPEGRGASGLLRILPALLPALLLILALILPGYMFESDRSASQVGLGPAMWPDIMLSALAALTAIWLGYEIWVLLRAERRPLLMPTVDEERYHYGKAVVGMALILTYGWLMPVLGFALATSSFIAIWCLYGGLRPVIVVPLTLIGTLALLWLFMGLALMPLPRGAGMFGDFSIWLLQTTGIY